MQKGSQSFKFDIPVYIEQTASVVGEKESEGPLGRMFDVVIKDPMSGKDNWEQAESALQEAVVDKLLMKTSYKKEQIRYILSGDLLGQLIATSFGISKYEIPHFGIYGACSTFGEALSLGALIISAGAADRLICMASSHFASAEKQFRFPLEYGNQRPKASTWTVTGSGAAVITNERQPVAITGITTGKIIDYGVKDSMNMGACMAPAAADLIVANFKDFETDEKYYDRIITGDLGTVGREILINLVKEKGYVGKTVTIGIRPEDLHDDEAWLQASPKSVIEATIRVYELLGAEVNLYFDIDDAQFIARVNPRTTARVGSVVKIALDMSKVHVFDKETELIICN